MTEDSLDKRHHLSIVFSDITNSTKISSTLEPEIYSALLEQFREIASEVIKRHGGIDIRIDGDGVIFIFGYPQSHEDAGRRAVEAAVDLHKAIAELDQSALPNGIKLKLHTGIHSGVVLLRAGDMVRGRYEILGDATNVAKRLCDFASSNEIIVSDNTLGADSYFFNIGQSRRIKIRGKKTRLLVHNIIGREPISNRFAARAKRGVSLFSGRKIELEQLHQCLKKTELGHNRLAIISGSAGMGKSRLVSEFLKVASKQGHSVHQGYCESYLGARPLQPIRQLLVSVLTGEYGIHQSLDIETLRTKIDFINPEITEVLFRLLSPEISPASTDAPQINALVTSILALLNNVKSDSPLIFCVDDWQWIDDASRRVLETLLTDTKQPIFFIYATRPQDNATPLPHAEIVHLVPLKDSDAHSAITDLLESPEPFIIEKIIERAGGNPLFIEELCHAVNDEKYNFEEGGVITPLETLIHSRFARLPKNQAKLIETASVIGHMIPVWLFQDITGIEPGHEDFSVLSKNDFLYPSDMSGMLKFKHGIARDVIYGVVNLHERIAIHGRIVDALHRHSKAEAANENVEALAYHYSQSGFSGKASHYAIIAGDRALASSALDIAQAQYKQALKELSSLESSSQRTALINSVIRKFGIVSIVDPSWEQVPVLEDAVTLTKANNDKKGEAWAQYWLGFICYGLGEPSLAIHHLELAKDIAATLDSSTLSLHIHANLGQAYGAASNYKKALKFLNHSIRIKQTLKMSSGLAESLAYSQSCKGFVLADQGNFKDADNCFDESQSVLETEVGHDMATWLANHRSASRLWQGRYDEALEDATLARNLAEGQKSRYHFAMAKALIYGAKLHKAYDHDTLENLIITTDWMTRSASQQFISLNYGWLTKILIEQGKIDQARHYAALSLLRARKGDRLGEAMTYRALARLAFVGQTNHSVQHYLSKAYSSASQRGAHHEKAKTHFCEAEIALKIDDFKTARASLSHANKLFENLDMHFHTKKIEQLQKRHPQLANLSRGAKAATH